jgi:hypothetical protein
MNNKIIITNLAALKTKYGTAGVKEIDTAIKTLIEADKARGLTTQLVALDSVAAMKRVDGKNVTNPTDPKQNKVAIDAVCTALVPDYLLILGASDVVPHQDLRNPMFGSDDPDEFALGDVPYACSAPYSQEPKDFIGPTSVVGRLPDLTGASDPAYLIDLLRVAAKWKSLEAADYAGHFAVSAEVWKESTALSLQKLFGSSTDLSLSPPKGPQWDGQILSNRVHFINCHGAPADPKFYGQRGSNYPVAHEAAYVDGKVTEGTVAAIECCYGAELYDPSLAGGQAGICSTYLASKAYGYFGSTTIAYGPAIGNGAADLLCQYFLRRIIVGASLGRAALEARLEFAGGAPELDPVDLKTLAQFNLLGDPSIHPVAVQVAQTALVQVKGLAATSKSVRAEASAAAVARTDRRRQLLARGLRIGATQAVATKIARPKLSGPVLRALKKVASELKISEPKILSFKVESPAVPKGRLARSMKAGAMAKLAAPSGFHVVTGTERVSEIRAPQIVAIVAKEVAGKIISYREMHSR